MFPQGQVPELGMHNPEGRYSASHMIKLLRSYFICGVLCSHSRDVIHGYQSHFHSCSRRYFAPNVVQIETADSCSVAHDFSTTLYTKIDTIKTDRA